MTEPRSDDPNHEEEIERLHAELQAARAALGDFAYAVSHDLRASLRHILSYASLLREEAGGTLTGEAANYLDTIQGASRTLAQQIDGLMAWSQLDRAELRPQEVVPALLIAEAQAQLASACEGRRIVWQIQDDLPVLFGDAAMLRQLFVHLFSNALKFTRDRACAEIVVRAELVPAGWVTYTVGDNGVGFDPVRQHKLFHVFQRLHSANQFEGLGLGLAQARKIIERHGGSIRAEGAPDAGCRLSFTLLHVA
jgi:light-regulated signal transduction histidine kinase (bacteriophytochrome)